MRRILVNTDTSAGDAVALLLALADPAVEVVGITVTCGNSAFDQQVENALYTLEVAGRGGAVPVYPGCRDPILGRYRSVPEVWGADGMGDSAFPPARQRPEGRHAVDALLDLAERHAGELEIVSLGPVTNLAVALVRAPELARRVKAIYVMSGCLHGQGNITLGAEYNAWVDPEAARIVFHAGANLVLVPWEVAVRDAFVTPGEEEEIARLDTARSRFYGQVTRVVREYTRARRRPGIVHADCLAMLVALQPATVRERRRMFVDVEVAGELGRGVTFFDWTGTRPPNVEVVFEVDRPAVLRRRGEGRPWRA
jgi:purine nucleosidase